MKILVKSFGVASLLLAIGCFTWLMKTNIGEHFLNPFSPEFYLLWGSGTLGHTFGGVGVALLVE